MMPQKLYEWRAKLPCVSTQRDKLSAYLDHELDANTRSEVEKHIEGCSRCQAEIEQLRFASHAMSYFVVPESRASFWQADQFVERPQALPVAMLSKFWAKKITLPAPVAIFGGLSAIIIIAALFFNRPTQPPTPSASKSASIKAAETKIVEVPVERVVYVQQRRLLRSVKTKSRLVNNSLALSLRDRTNLVSTNAQLANGRLTLPSERGSSVRDSKKNDQRPLTHANMMGFRPAPNSNLRIVKELD